jgi:hypothetical protein
MLKKFFAQLPYYCFTFYKKKIKKCIFFKGVNSASAMLKKFFAQLPYYCFTFYKKKIKKCIFFKGVNSASVASTSRILALTMFLSLTVGN